MNKTRYSRVVIAIFLAFMLSAFNIVPVFADESAPTEVAPTEEGIETVEEEVSEEVSEVDVTEEVSEGETEPKSLSVAELIESLPENTDLIVLNEGGEALPLVSEEAAEVLEGGDPQWCPVGVTPGATSCSPTFATFTGAGGLIDWLVNNQASVAKAGVIWVEASYDSSLESEDFILLDGSQFSQPGASMDDFALTINGGWAGGTSKTLNPNTPSVFDLPFLIHGWTGAITINNIVIDGASGVGYDALYVYTSGNIVLNNVDVQNTTTERGTYLHNASGTGSVTVNDSTFNHNAGTNADGLVIYSANSITLKNVTAMHNTNSGAYIDNSFATTPKSVTLKGINHFSYNNGWNGLTIYATGAITLSNLTAVGNAAGSGAYLDNGNSGTKPYAVTIKGTNNFSKNGRDGLRIYTLGAITVSNITANDNGTDPNRPAAEFLGGDINNPDDYDLNAYGKGAYLYNFIGLGKPQPITITGTNTFNGNASTGLFIDSNGAVKINNLTANENGCNPLKDRNPKVCAGAYISGAGVTLIGYNFFIGNVEDGLEVFNNYVPSKNDYAGAITLSNLYAVGNGETGVIAVTDGNKPNNVTIKGTNIFNDNVNGHGLVVLSNGVVTVSNVTANGNEAGGVSIFNYLATTPKAVTITGTNTFNNNHESGLMIVSYGAITLNNVTANLNTVDGVFLDNCRLDLGDSDTDGNANDCLAYSPQPVTMKGINVASENGDTGILIVSRGAITVSNITAETNNNIGVHFLNGFSNSVGGITQMGYLKVSNTKVLSGLLAVSNGSITLANITADNNGSIGAIIENNTNYVNPVKPASITLTGVNSFSGNGSNGLQIKSFGAVVLNHLTANDNGDANVPEIGSGVYIDNTFSTKAMPITLNGNNTFNGNFGIGLDISSHGAIKVNNLIASYNTWEGANLDNQHDLFSAPVTLSGYVIANNNGYGGLIVYSNGHVKTSNVTANNNQGYLGVYINNYWNATPGSDVNVSMSGVNFFNDNDVVGLMIITDGAITLSNISANSNGNDGVSLQANKNITLNGSNTFNSNRGDGLSFVTNGNAILNRITANYNSDTVFGSPYGAGIYGTAGGNITISCGSFNFNEGVGYDLTVSSGKKITLKGVFSFGNPSGNYSSSAPSVTRTCPLP